MDRYNQHKLKILFFILISFLSACSSVPGQSKKILPEETLTIINWGKDFDSFWKDAKHASFPKQLSLWNERVEKPHQSFYSFAVWRNTESADFAQRKSKRLEESFQSYVVNNAQIHSNFESFDETLRLQIKKFKSIFPSARFENPIMAVLAPTFNGKTDSYEAGGKKHFLAFGIDTLTIRHDDPNVLYSHELFHLYHGEVGGIKDDGAAPDSLLIDSLWAEGLATYVSKELNPSASMSSVFMDDALAKSSENTLPYLAREFLKIKDENVYSDLHPDVYENWFLLNKCPLNLSPCRSGYFLGFYVAKSLRQRNSLDEMAHWPIRLARKKIIATLNDLAI